jgi:protein phosphatase/protein phosphatase 1L
MELTDQIVYDALEDIASHVKFFAIYNGHGCRGIDLAEIFKKKMRIKLIENRNIISKFKEIKDVKLYFTEYFKSFQNKIPKDIPEYHYSGICVIIVLIIYNKMFVINLGDSRCIIGQKTEKEKKCKAITIEHIITRDDEKKRILENWGEIKEDNNGILMIYAKNDNCLHIEISRSLGDTFGHEIGVSCEPDVFEKELNNEDRFIAIGNSRIWNIMKNNEVMEFIFNKMETNDKNNCSRLLIQECWQKWEEKNLAENKYDIEHLACIINFINIKQSGK